MEETDPQPIDLTVCVVCLYVICLENPLSLLFTKLLNCWVFEGVWNYNRKGSLILKGGSELLTHYELP